MKEEILLKEAIEASKNAYAPYSNFKVGAAILTKNGNIYRGCNVENASYGLTICAERTAVFNAVINGEKEFLKIAIYVDNEEILFPPCGACRQVLYEFSPEMEVIYFNKQKKERTILKNLLPAGFSLESER